MKSYKIFLLSIFIVSSTLFSCKKEAETISTATKRDLSNVAYGTDTAQKMDVYLPANRDTLNTKVILFIHGGSWTSGDKTDFTENIMAIRDQLPNYAFFNINYKLVTTPENRYPAQIDDIQKCISFIKSRTTDYNVNPNKIVIVGASAGAHLALIYGYKYNADHKIKAVIDLFGPTDLTDMYNNHPFKADADLLLANFLGTTPQLDPTLYYNASPINFVTSQTVPTKIFHGDVDSIVPISQSYRLHDTLVAHNVKVDMTVYPGQSHGWYDDMHLNDTYAKITAFIKENVQ